jgi:hypothetical protein
MRFIESIRSFYWGMSGVIDAVYTDSINFIFGKKQNKFELEIFEDEEIEPISDD